MTTPRLRRAPARVLLKDRILLLGVGADVRTLAADIDRRIEAKAEHWKLSRMAVVDRNILRLAIYELDQQVVPAPIVIDEAIDLTEFLVDLTIKHSRFAPGAPTVGGPIEIAAISKHEGFRWIQRKYYYSRDLNPEEAQR